MVIDGGTPRPNNIFYSTYKLHYSGHNYYYKNIHIWIYFLSIVLVSNYTKGLHVSINVFIL